MTGLTNFFPLNYCRPILTKPKYVTSDAPILVNSFEKYLTQHNPPVTSSITLRSRTYKYLIDPTLDANSRKRKREADKSDLTGKRARIFCARFFAMPIYITRQSPVSEIREASNTNPNSDQEMSEDGLTLKLFKSGLFDLQDVITKHETEFDNIQTPEERLKQVISETVKYYEYIIEKRKRLIGFNIEQDLDSKMLNILITITKFRHKLSERNSDDKQLEAELKQPYNDKDQFLLDAYICYWAKHIVASKNKHAKLGDMPQKELEELVHNLSLAFTFMISKRIEIDLTEFNTVWKLDLNKIFAFIEKCRGILAKKNHDTLTVEQLKRPTKAKLDNFIFKAGQFIDGFSNYSEENAKRGISDTLSIYQCLCENRRNFYKEGENIIWDRNIEKIDKFLKERGKIYRAFS